MSDAYHNQRVGGQGGTDWGSQLYDNDQKVHSIDAWWGPASDAPQYTVLRGLRLSWNDGQERQVGHQDDYLPHRGYTFDDDENIQSMTLHGAIGDPYGRADALEFHTTKNRDFFAGGDGGGPLIQEVGTGVLYGFDGAADADIDSLGAIVQD
ncbi:hypothetical protein P170DRAFT_465071 [Aspergillus steynii IBT 23096]|uniref:Jacalin-type lectin domain-containing protein n=1 Tax=Aspergillus steynii IBT 23096 TaxID=1392250 RepID=A0A2I2GA44_9EURO|nr:uncharacterized protein P170DRAFT_465071 [Aspergillus steynii IBT 23096]PLB49746.1 hypothetical protein P170DRAFT_465071 [Aspergillus steynii IBT 23096]